MRFTAIALGLVYSTICLAQIDTRSLESVMNSTFVEVIGYHEFLELTYNPTGDEETTVSKLEIDHNYSNFDLGRLKASLITQTVPLASNLNDRMFFDANLSTNITDTEDERKSFDLQGVVNLQGHVLHLLKFVSDQFEDCTQTPINDDTANSVHLGNILCYVRTGIESSNTVIELQSGFQEAANYAKLVYGTDEESDSILGDFFSSLEIKQEDGNLVLSVAVDTEIKSGEGDVNKNNLTAVFNATVREDGVSISLDGNVIFEERQLNEYIELVTKIATDLANRESNTHITYYEDNLYLVFGLIEAFLIPEDDEDDDF